MSNSKSGALAIKQSPIAFKQVLPSALAILFFGCGSFFIYPSWTWFGRLGASAILFGCGLGLFLYGVAYVLTCTPRFMSKDMRQILATLNAMFAQFSWSQIVLISILAGVGEEMLLRALIQTWLHHHLHPVFAILIASLIFGLLHYMNFTYVVVTFVGGLILGVAFYLSGSLILVMVAHAVYDICAFTLIVKFPHILGINSNDEFSNTR